MVIGTLVEAMYYDHEIIEEASKTDDEMKDINGIYLDTLKKHIEKSGGQFSHSGGSSLGISMFSRNGGTIDDKKLNNELADAYHEYEKKKVPSNIIQKMIHKLRMLYNKWLHKANAEKGNGNIGFFKNILRVIANWIDKFLLLLQGRKAYVKSDVYQTKHSDKFHDTTLRI